MSLKADNQTVMILYATLQKQTLIHVPFVPYMSVGEVIKESHILTLHPEIDLKTSRVGIFGKFVELEHFASAGDRIEIYRPLKRNPQSARGLR